MDFELNEEQRLMIHAVREFADGEIVPRAREMDEEARIPQEILDQMTELGLFGAVIPEAYGGTGLDTLTYSGVIEELARACGGISIVLSVHCSVAAYPLLRFGTEEQRQRLLPEMAGGKIGAFCLSEPDHGSDAGSIQTSARKDGNDYLLNGQKVFVTNGKIGSYYLVIARTDPEVSPRHRGISAFFVHRDTPGLTLGRKEEKMGLRASDTMEVFFEDCRVPAENLIGKEGEGFKIAMMSLDNGRIGVGSQALGIARAAFEEAVRYARERKQFGHPLVHFQAIQNKLADMGTRIKAARLLVQQAAWMKDQSVPFSCQAAMAKVYASEMATWVTHQSAQIFGGYGYMKEYPVERYYRDARVTEIYEGTSEMQRLVIARSLLHGNR